jgi:hypothetical protein
VESTTTLRSSWREVREPDRAPGQGPRYQDLAFLLVDVDANMVHAWPLVSGALTGAGIMPTCEGLDVVGTLDILFLTTNALRSGGGRGAGYAPRDCHRQATVAA